MIQENTNIELNVAEIFKLYGQAHKYSPGEIIFQKGDSTDKIYYIIKGRVRTYCLNECGDEITLFYVDENQLIGSESLSSIQKRKISVDSVTDVHLYSIDASLFLEKCIKNKVSILNLMEFFINKIIVLSNYICCNRFMKNNEKLAYFLYANSSSDVVQYTHEQIALLTGMNRVSVTRLLKSFAEKNLISQQYKEIRILNMKGLADIFNSIGYFID
ncbi:MAG: Crp/Fnr family transcriptional regulator [Sedimentibacter sp.]|uniref:Crp/Fnr family transcriptional regulator n=1 Tax=Sedimentibacter sp. TaxID=1960295 RepID=UPI0031587DAE